MGGRARGGPVGGDLPFGGRRAGVGRDRRTGPALRERWGVSGHRAGQGEGADGPRRGERHHRDRGDPHGCRPRCRGRAKSPPSAQKTRTSTGSPGVVDPAPHARAQSGSEPSGKATDLVEVVGLTPGEPSLVDRGWLECAVASTRSDGHDRRGRARVIACDPVSGPWPTPTGRWPPAPTGPGPNCARWSRPGTGGAGSPAATSPPASPTSTTSVPGPPARPSRPTSSACAGAITGPNSDPVVGCAQWWRHPHLDRPHRLHHGHPPHRRTALPDSPRRPR